MSERILWIRELSCGHERPTNIAFYMKIYKKPKIGEECYCRECFETTIIVGVRNSKQTSSSQKKPIASKIENLNVDCIS